MWLKRLAYIWIVQNVILTISVFIRTIHYVSFHGLASLRIGLMIFLLLVLFGLVTLTIKIKQQRNLAYILRMNSAFILGTLMFTSCLPWDKIILNHNLTHGNINEIDVDNYLNMSTAIYPLVYANLNVIEKQINAHQRNKVRWISYGNIESFKKVLDNRKELFLEKESREKIHLSPDEVVDEKGIKFIIDPAATLFLIGSTVDWQEDKFKSGFVFLNPNETSRCGCGESFSV